MINEGVAVTTTIAAIETSYKGCRFRSRLEARWAVFFDALNIEWQYEPEGYVIDGEGYLPDFWVAELGVWVEVKGAMSHRDLRRVIRAADARSGLPSGHGMSYPESPEVDPNSWGPRVLILGPIPEPGKAWTHCRLDYLAGEVIAFPVIFTKGVHNERRTLPVGNPLLVGRMDGLTNDDEAATAASRQSMVTAQETAIAHAGPQVNDAYRAARSARFEHGESGAPVINVAPTRTETKPIDPYHEIAPLLKKVGRDFGGALDLVIERYDMDTAEGRVAALRSTAPLVATVDNWELQEHWTTTLATRLGMKVDTVRRFVEQSVSSKWPRRDPWSTGRGSRPSLR